MTAHVDRRRSKFHHAGLSDFIYWLSAIGMFAAPPVPMGAKRPNNVRQQITECVAAAPALQTQPVTVIVESNCEITVQSAMADVAGTLPYSVGQRHVMVAPDGKAA